MQRETGKLQAAPKENFIDQTTNSEKFQT